MCRGFVYGKACVRLSPRLIPKHSCLLLVVCLSVMVRYQLGLRLLQLRKSFHDGSGDPRMQLAAPRAEQSAVGRVLHERVLEEVERLRRNTAAEQEPGLDEPVEP